MIPRKRSPAPRTRLANLADAVYQGLCEEIASGKLLPGETLSRRQVARRYGCSYSPVIEAMVRLTSARLIEAESAQMARVVRATTESIRGVYALLEALETQAIRLACEMAMPDEIDDLHARAEALDARIALRNARDKQGPLLHSEFHKRIAQLSRVPTLVHELERSQLLLRCQTTWVVTAEAMKDPPRWHSMLVDPIRSRDPLAADAAMRAHIRRGLEKELMGYQMRLSQSC